MYTIVSLHACAGYGRLTSLKNNAVRPARQREVANSEIDVPRCARVSRPRTGCRWLCHCPNHLLSHAVDFWSAARYTIFCSINHSFWNTVRANIPGNTVWRVQRAPKSRINGHSELPRRSDSPHGGPLLRSARTGRANSLAKS